MFGFTLPVPKDARFSGVMSAIRISQHVHFRAACQGISPSARLSSRGHESQATTGCDAARQCPPYTTTIIVISTCPYVQYRAWETFDRNCLSRRRHNTFWRPGRETIPTKVTEMKTFRSWETNMSSSVRFVIALLFGLTIAANTSMSSAQDNAARDAAILRCIKQVTPIPGDDMDTQRGRTAVYKACITTAGFQP